MASKTWRFDGTVECEVTLWINAEDQATAEAMLAAAEGTPDDLVNTTTISNIDPDISTMVINTIRESTGENP